MIMTHLLIVRGRIEVNTDPFLARAIRKFVPGGSQP